MLVVVYASTREIGPVSCVGVYETFNFVDFCDIFPPFPRLFRSNFVPSLMCNPRFLLFIHPPLHKSPVQVV